MILQWDRPISSSSEDQAFSAWLNGRELGG
jgi:hypothetical protein